jgi:hypothetical protein
MANQKKRKKDKEIPNSIQLETHVGQTISSIIGVVSTVISSAQIQ